MNHRNDQEKRQSDCGKHDPDRNDKTGCGAMSLPL